MKNYAITIYFGALLHIWTIKTPILYIGIRQSRIPEYNKGDLSVTKATKLRVGV